MPDYTHFFISVPPRVAPAEMVKHLKGVSARRLLKACPELRQKLVRGHLWTSTYYVATVGSASEGAVQSYVESQRKR
jgi:putative transposase